MDMSTEIDSITSADDKSVDSDDTLVLPELSFDDLLKADESPVKKVSNNNFLQDSQTTLSELDLKQKQLNTPGPKKPPTQASLETPAKSAATQLTATLLKIPKTMMTSTAAANTPSNSTKSALAVSSISNSFVTSNSNNKLTTSVAVKLSSPKLISNNNSVILNTTQAKAITTASQGHFIKMSSAKQINSTVTVNAASATTTNTTPAGMVSVVGPLKKTAVKTANGQIIYLQRKIGSNTLPVRIAAPGPVATKIGTTAVLSSASGTKTTAPSSAPAASVTTVTNSAGKQTVAIHVIRTADGNLVPLKTTVGQLARKKIIATSGALGSNPLLIKSPIQAITVASSTAAATSTSTSGFFDGPTKPKLAKLISTNSVPSPNPASISKLISTNSVLSPNPASVSKLISTNSVLSANPASTPSTTAAINTSVTATSTSGKIIVQTANGKQLFSQQNIIKLSPHCAGGNSSGGQIQAIQIPGKSGFQYVRVYNSPGSLTQKISSAVTLPTQTAGSTTTAVSAALATNSANRKLLPATTVIAATSAVTTNAQPKFSFVRQSTPAMKMFIKSPRKDMDGFQQLPITSKVQKTIVTMPPLRKFNDLKIASPTATTTTVTVTNNSTTTSSIAATTNQIKTFINTNASATAPTVVSSAALVLKPRISEINSEIKRFSSGGGTTTTVDTTKKIVVLPQSMLRTNFTTINKPVGSTAQRITIVQSKSGNVFSPPKKLFSVLKPSSENNEISIPDKKRVAASNSVAAEKKQQTQQQLVSEAQKVVKTTSSTSQQKASVLQHSYNQKQQQVVVKKEPKVEENGNNQNDHVVIKQEPKCESDTQPSSKSAIAIDDSNTIRRKHCNCTKSQCLKLYCDCFANGEFCQDCNCKDCFNNLQYEDERQKAIRICLERNPSAFKPKITTSRNQSDLRLHNKGCNCKRSGCLKNYCECYEAKISCSSNCKCIGCRNFEDRPDLDMDPMDNAKHNNGSCKGNVSSGVGMKRTYENRDDNLKNGVPVEASSSLNCAAGPPAEKQSCNFITQDVIDATIQCMIAQADECEKNGLPGYQTEKMVMEELGRCLVEIIDFSIRNTETN